MDLWTMKHKVHFIILFVYFGLLSVIMYPRQADADSPYDTMGMLFANVDAGYETMHLNGNGYQKYNHGFSTTLSAGINILCIMGLQIEQDLGFIDVRRTIEGSSKREALIKGATFVTFPMFSPTLSEASESLPNIMAHIKLGLGGMYMQAPKGAGKSVQGWFAFRPAIAFLWLSDKYGHDGMGGGIEFDYTLAYANSNVFDHRDLVHFFGLKAKFMMTF